MNFYLIHKEFFFYILSRYYSFKPNMSLVDNDEQKKIFNI